MVNQRTQHLDRKKFILLSINYSGIMDEWINSVISSDQAGIIVLVAVFLLGVISVFTCVACNFAVLGVVGGYTGTLSASFLKGSMLWGFALLFFYALGYGITLAAAMLGVGLGLGKISKILTKSAVVIKYAGGITLIILGFYFLITV